MRHHRGNAPLFGSKQVARQGLQDQADKPQQLQGVLPQLVDRAADTAEQQDADVLFLGCDRHAKIAHRGIDRLQQGAVGGGEFLCGVGQLADALCPQQLHQQRSPGRIDAGHVVQVDGGLGIVLADQLFGLLLEACVMGKRPVAADQQSRRITGSV